MGGRPHFRETRFQNARFIRIILRQNATRIIKVEAPYIMRFIRHGEGFCQVQQVPGSLINMHAVAELAQQQHKARAVQHELDHLDGLLFLDRLVSRKQDLFARKVYKK